MKRLLMGKQAKVDFEFHEKQLAALDMLAALPSQGVLTYGGAKEGGKTVLGDRWCILKCIELINQFHLRKSSNPPQVGFIGRKRGSDLHKTTLETFRQTIPAELYRFNQQHSEIVVLDRVKMSYGGFDDRETIQKFNSMELVFYFIDQAEEISEDEWGMIHLTLRPSMWWQQLTQPDKQLPAFRGLLSCNPANVWIKHKIVKANNPAMPFLSALPADNPYLPADRKEKFMTAFGHRPEIIAALWNGSWDSLEGARVCIKDIWLDAADRIRRNFPARRIIALDVAEYGDDECVATLLNNTDIEATEIWGQVGRAESCNRASVFGKNHGGGIPFVVDCDGMGIEVARGLRDLDETVIEFWGSAPSTTKPEKYCNTRAEMWWGAGEEFAAGDIELHNCPNELRRQLTSVEYDFRNGRIIIEPKTDIKSRIGRSPDHADSYLMGLWGRKHAVGESDNVNVTIRSRAGAVPSTVACGVA